MYKRDSTRWSNRNLKCFRTGNFILKFTSRIRDKTYISFYYTVFGLWLSYAVLCACIQCVWLVFKFLFMEIALLSWYIYLMRILRQSLTKNSAASQTVGVAIDIDKCIRATNVENKNKYNFDGCLSFLFLSAAFQYIHALFLLYNTNVKTVLLRNNMHHLLDVWDYQQPDRENRNDTRILKISTVLHKTH